MSDFTLRLRATEQILAEHGFASLGDAQAALDEERFGALMLAIAARERKLLKKHAPREVALGDGLLGSAPTPRATKALLGVNVAVFLAQYLLTSASAPPGAPGPDGGGAPVPNPALALFYTAFQPTSRGAVALNHCWPLLTSCFMHLGLAHIAMNMLSLIVLGGMVERLYGSLRFLGLYLASGVVGSIVGALVQGPGVGASGAISGMVGVLAVMGLRGRGSGRLAADIAWGTARWAIVASILFTLVSPNIGWSAHLGGALAGAALALVVPPERQVLTGLRARLVSALAVVLVAGPLLLLLPLLPALARAG